MKFHLVAAVTSILALPVAAQAQSTLNDKAEAAAETTPPPAITVIGSVAIASDHRFRGVSQFEAKLADNVSLDVGLTWYMYPGGADKTDFAEPYAKLTGTTGPATLTAGVAYAAYLRPSVSKGQDGTGNIAGGTLGVSPTAAF